MFYALVATLLEYYASSVVLHYYVRVGEYRPEIW